MNERTAPECGCVTGGKIVRGMCATHYYQWHNATPASQRGVAPKFTRKFEDYIDKSAGPDACWPWAGPTDSQGYGRWTKGGIHQLAHRVSLQLSEEPSDPRLLACHHCDNPPCANPAHLYWGTAADNRRDFIGRGGPIKAQERCKWGHEMTGDNVRIVGDGPKRHRACRECVNRRSREYAQRKREVSHHEQR